MDWQKILKINLHDTYIYAAIDAGDVKLSTDPDVLRSLGLRPVANRWILPEIVEWTEQELEDMKKEAK